MTDFVSLVEQGRYDVAYQNLSALVDAGLQDFGISFGLPIRPPG